MVSSYEKGRVGEITAINYLLDNGYTILERNFRTRYGEIDIIGRDREYICFIEVKSRKNYAMGYPCEAVDNNKQRKITRMALLYISKNNLYQENFRFDVLEMILNNGSVPYIRLIKDAFSANCSF